MKNILPTFFYIIFNESLATCSFSTHFGKNERAIADNKNKMIKLYSDVNKPSCVYTSDPTTGPKIRNNDCNVWLNAIAFATSPSFT